MEHIEWRGDQSGRNGEISSQKRCGDTSGPVVGMSREMIVHRIALQDTQKALEILAVAIFRRYMFGHRAVDGGYAVTCHQAMYGGDVAEANHPFGIGPKRKPVKIIKQMNRAITASTAYNGIYAGISQRIAQRFKSCAYGS